MGKYYRIEIKTTTMAQGMAVSKMALDNAKSDKERMKYHLTHGITLKLIDHFIKVHGPIEIANEEGEIVSKIYGKDEPDVTPEGMAKYDIVEEAKIAAKKERDEEDDFEI